MNDNGGGLWGLLATRWAAGESRVNENWTHGPRSKFAVPMLEAVGLFAGLLGVIGSFALMLHAVACADRWGWDFWRLARLSIGACGVPTCAILSRHMSKELIDPFWRTSPFERQLAPALVDMLENTRQGDTADVGRIVPYRVNGQLAATSGAVLDAVPIARADARMLDFLALAAEMNAPPTRRAMGAEGRGRYMLRQSGERLSRELYDAIVDDLEEPWHFVRHGRRGQATEWAKTPAHAYAIIAQELAARSTSAAT